MRELKKITSLALACFIALTFCACLPLKQLLMKNDDFTKYPKKTVAKVDNNFIKWCDCKRFYVNGHEIRNCTMPALIVCFTIMLMITV